VEAFENKIKERGEANEFQQVELTKAEKKQDRFARAFEDAIGRIIVPNVARWPLSRIEYTDIAAEVLMTNGTAEMNHIRMKSMFRALVAVFDFECKCEREEKLNEVLYLPLHTVGSPREVANICYYRRLTLLPFMNIASLLLMPRNSERAVSVSATLRLEALTARVLIQSPRER